MSLAINALRTSSRGFARFSPSSTCLVSSRASNVAGHPRYYSEAKSEEATKEDAKPSGSSSEAPSDPEKLNEKLKAKEAEVVDLTSRLRYLQADFLNLQRNAAREKEQTKDYAITRFASDLLETVDVLALALKSVPESALASTEAADSSSATATPSTKTPTQYLAELHNGVSMTHRLLLSTLFKYNVKPFDPTGDVFDPNRHEALYQAPIPNATPGTVIDCQKTGYMIRDRVLRAAQVGVVQGDS